MVLTAIKWLAFAWGCFCVAVMIYFAQHFFPDAANIRNNEMWMGFMLGAIYGWPAWLALPAIAFVQRRERSWWQQLLMLAPLFAAIGLLITSQLLVRGVL